MKKLNKKGFTIVELVIVIAVIAILAAVLIPTYTSVVDKANKSKALQEAKAAYTIYLSEVLSGDIEGVTKPESKILVKVDGISVYITDGQASTTAPSDSSSYKEYVIKTADGKDNTLESSSVASGS